jgi:hypothetical protein
MTDIDVEPHLDPASDRLLTSAQLKHRWGGCSDMKLYRRLKDDPNMPKPLDMHGRRLWYLSAVIHYERLLAERPAKVRTMPPKKRVGTEEPPEEGFLAALGSSGVGSG